MTFPSGVAVEPWVPPLVAFLISAFTSVGGVSGASLLLPFQMSVLGYTTPGVSATNHLFNVVAIPGGVYRYAREGRLVWPLSAVVVAATLPGVLLGAWIRVAYLPDPRRFKVFAAFVLLALGVRMARSLLPGGEPAAQADTEERFQQLQRERKGGKAPLPAVEVERFGWSRVTYTFLGERFSFATPALFGLSFVVGLAGGVYGIGGGAFLAPFFVAFFGLPVYTVAGAALLGTFATSLLGVASFQLLGWLRPDSLASPDYPLGLLFGLGGAAGMYTGARLQKYLPARLIKAILSAVVLFLAALYLKPLLFQ